MWVNILFFQLIVTYTQKAERNTTSDYQILSLPVQQATGWPTEQNSTLPSWELGKARTHEVTKQADHTSV